MRPRRGQIEGVLLDDRIEFSFPELCRASGLHAEAVIALVELGLVEPIGRSPREWRFTARALCRLLSATRLQEDLNVNVEGAVLAVELLEEVRDLRARVRALEALVGG